jgi:hypothetical protein
MMNRAPRSLAVVEDPRFLTAARRLIGAAVRPFHAEGIRYLGEAGSHDDAGPGVTAVRRAGGRRSGAAGHA